MSVFPRFNIYSNAVIKSISIVGELGEDDEEHLLMRRAVLVVASVFWVTCMSHVVNVFRLVDIELVFLADSLECLYSQRI